MTTRLRVRFAVVASVILLSVAVSGQWETPSRGFHKASMFPLDGRHLTVACASCHVNGQVKGTPTACADCHWVRRQDDPYRARLGMACESCHRTSSWTAVKWDHATMTGMPLNVAHRSLGCESCHKDGSFASANATCVTCHTRDFAATKTPDHRAAGFPTTCELCHRPADSTFTQGRFDHSSRFQLLGVHATAACSSCHRNGVYQGTPRDCVGCHRTDFEMSTSPNHVTAGFSTDCASCHRPTDPGFGTGAFNHSSVFPLVGQHATQACASCHVSGVFKGTSRDCVGCHRTEFEKTTRPNHVAAGFSTDCASCHKPSDPSFATGAFNHTSVFPLVGQHAAQACTSCHVNSVYRGTARDCVGCHRTDFERTTRPNHVASGFSTDCASCHRPTDSSFGTGSFNHSSVFPLVGQHATQTCVSCHAAGVYKGTPRDCVGCHRATYDRTTAPNHAAAGFSTGCDSCHRPADPSWRGGSFDHNTVFQLLGRHATAVCGVCHAGNVYRGTPRDCVGCHRASYERTTAPSHVAAQFPMTCEVCHRAADTSWTQGRFTHAWFPITSGRHSGHPCSACHANPANFTQFTCLTCHTRTETDSKHRERAGYAYDSNRCYACHPNGRAD